MPFITKESRKQADRGRVKVVGDLCYLFYKQLKKGWDTERRWTTAHNQFKEMFGLDDQQAAKQLAWWVHFVLNVIPYEIEKRAENGDVEG